MVTAVDRNFQPRTRVLVRPKLEPLYFGVAWDKQTVPILNAITYDVISYNRVVPAAQAKLVLVSPDYDWLIPLGMVMDIEVTSDPNIVKQCFTWKLYYEEKCPELPNPEADHVYFKKVTNREVKRVRLQPGREGYPSLYNPSDNQIIPPSRSPNINKLPPRYYPGQNLTHPVFLP